MANSAHYLNVSPDVYNQLRSQLSGMGIDLQGQNGRISQKGVSADYAYDDASQTLSIANVKVGFPASMMFSADKIIDKISEAVTSSGGQKA